MLLSGPRSSKPPHKDASSWSVAGPSCGCQLGDPGTHTRDRDYSEVDLECILHIYCQLVMLELLDEIVLSALQHRVLSTNIDLPQA